MQESYDECVKLLDLMELTDEIGLYKGAEMKMPDENTPAPSEQFNNT